MNPSLLITQRRRLHYGFTLAEVMIAITILGLVSAGTLRFFVQALNIYHYDVGKNLVNKDIRKFTTEMTDNATYANYFLIFPSFSNRTTTQTVTDPTSGATSTVTVDTSVNDGQSGDMLVLVFKDDSDPTKVARIVGYYRAPLIDGDPTSQGPVRTFDLTISPSSTAAVWSLLPPLNTQGTNPAIIELSLGLASGQLFYNLYDRSIMVKGQIFEAGNASRTATNTYNFTVSPRG